MRIYRFFALISMSFALATLPAAAQTVLTGDIEAATTNTFYNTISYNTISLNEAQCTDCTFTTSPQGNIASGTTSSTFVAVTSVPNPVGSYFSTTIRYASFYNGSQYGC